jgi:ribosomal protein S18 acetylase RimI-like enzyme
MQMEIDKVAFRIAELGDLNQIIQLLIDDELGRTREEFNGQIAPEYLAAFRDIEKDPNNEIIVGIRALQVIAVLQVTYIPNLSLKGAKRAQIEGVRVSSSTRGHGIGKLLIDFVLERARQKGCRLAQLTSNKSRRDAIRFYEELGFKPTHEGMKRNL